MELRPPETAARLAGWAGASFLLGVVLHSIWPYLTTPGWIILAAVVVGSAVWTLFGRSWPRVFAVCLLALILGVWRFDLGQRSMPRGLVPFSPKGLAYVSSSVNVSSPTDPRYWFVRWKRTLSTRATGIFSPDEASLLTGILYGDRTFSREMNDRFKRAGLVHLVAVSGSNVTIVVVMVMPLLLAFGLSRRRAFVGLSVALVAFVLFVNPSASVVRAAIMGWLVELAPVVGRIPRPSRLLLISAVAFTAWKPWSLMYDASFALSFLSMWGLLTWSRLAQERMSALERWPMLREITAATIGATIMTVPYTAWAFGQLTLFGLVTSLLALPLVPWTMATGFIALLFPSLFWLSLPAKGFLEAILWIARLPDLIPFGFWKNLSTPFGWMLGVYVMLYVIWRWFKANNRLIHRNMRLNQGKMSDKAAC